jgi:hypothetical protein
MTHNRYTAFSDKQEYKEVTMETVLIMIVLCIVLDIASLRWGVDSTEKLDSPEWERRVAWRGFVDG